MVNNKGVLACRYSIDSFKFNLLSGGSTYMPLTSLSIKEKLHSNCECNFSKISISGCFLFSV